MCQKTICIRHLPLRVINSQRSSLARSRSYMSELSEYERDQIIIEHPNRYMFGGGSAGAMTLDELGVLEKHLESWIYNIRSTKVYMYIIYYHDEFNYN